MSGWILPCAAASFWAGLLLWPVVNPGLPVWAWIVAGIGALASGLALAPPLSDGNDPVAAAGLVPAESEPDPLQAVAPVRTGAGRGPPACALVLVLLGVLALGAGWGGVHARRTEGSLLGRLAPRRVELEGNLRTDPSQGDHGWSAVLDVSSARWDGGAAALRESVWVQGPGDRPVAVRGDRVRVLGEIERPGDAGFATFLARRGLAVEIRADEVVRLGSASAPIIRSAQAFRAFVGRSIGRLFPAREAGLLMGLALGDDSRLDPDVARDFQATGLGHLLVVSGENVAMVLGPVIGLAAFLHLSRVPRFLLGLSTVVFFVVLTGAEPSVMRAGVMASLTLAGVFLGRPRSTAAILAGAVLVLLVLDPTLVWSIGFQLSVAATAGMIALASPVAERLRFLPRPVALAAGTTIAAQLGVTPILLFHFHEVPGVTVLANLLAFPAVSPALVLGLIAAGTGLLFEPLGRPLAFVAALPMRYLEVVADRLASAPLPWITSGGGLVPPIAGGLAVVLSAWWLRSGRRLPRAAIAVGCVLLPLYVWTSAVSSGPPSGLAIRFFAVGLGDAALVSSPEGANVLIDAGPDPVEVATKLSSLGVKRLDLVVATHPHADHVAGFPAVMARFPIGLVLEPGCAEPSPAYAEFLRTLAEEDLPVEHPRTGDTFDVGGIGIEVLAPEGCASGTDSDPNNDSLVLRVTYGEDVVLFGADAQAQSQQAMLDEHAPLAAEVLKVPHHGGDTSLVEFFHAVDPRLAVVSVGPNDYGHPVPSVLEELRATGAEVLRTDMDGDITVTFAPEGLLVESGA
ncbi:MAG: DNA internalization-related competence protein ComEC/Rec2 [Actinomycetota bacterium]